MVRGGLGGGDRAPPPRGGDDSGCGAHPPSPRLRDGPGTLATLAGLLLAGIVAAHGVHDLRGRASVKSGHLRLEIDTGRSHFGNGRCLRLLDELHVRDSRGRRLVGTVRGSTAGARCLLDYDLGENLEALTLQLRLTQRDMTANERVVLQPWRDGSRIIC